MPKVLKYLLWLVGSIVLLVGLGAAYNTMAPLPVYDVNLPDTVTIPYNDSLAIAEGGRLVSMTCVVCHQNQEGKLAGQPFPVDDFGQLYIRNITNHPEAGLRRYTNAELVHVLRTGVRPNGSQLIPMMPRYHAMADQDLYNIIAYLRSDAPPVQPVDQTWPDNELNFLGKALVRFAFKPSPMPTGPVVAPAADDLVARGEYLANVVFECYKCHSATFENNNGLEPALSEGYYGGGNSVMNFSTGEVAVSANLTMHPEHGLGQWTQEDFAKAVRQLVRPDGTLLASGAMPPFTALRDDEITAIWAFLQTVPVRDNKPLAEK